MLMANWFENRGARKNFEIYIKPTLEGKKVRYLEIGTWGGNSLLWVFKNILTNRRASAVVVDKFERVSERGFGKESKFRLKKK